jgi:putative transcriptional regulator
MTDSTRTLHTYQTHAGTLVRQFRQLLGLTQEQFAGRMGVTLPTINRWENDRSKPSPLALLRIKTMLHDLMQSSAEPYRMGAQDLLARYFADENCTAKTQRTQK